jgi:hypothetical protein
MKVVHLRLDRDILVNRRWLHDRRIQTSDDIWTVMVTEEAELLWLLDDFNICPK